MGGLVSGIGNLLGGTSNFQAQGINGAQLNGAMGTTNDALAQQNALAQSLQPQLQQGMGSQLQLGTALQQQAQGLGPNPAAAQLANATGQNIASQSALMAGQRGASANAGLMARQAGQQGAGIQQQAVGQNAVLQAQQQLAAQGQLQNLAQTQIGQQSGAVGANTNAALQNQGQMFNMMGSQNASNEAAQNSAQQRQAGAIGGLTNAAGSLLAGPVGSMFSSSSPNMNQANAITGGGFNPQMMAYDGGEVPDHMNQIHNLYHGGSYQPKVEAFKQGGQVPGTPQVKHDDIKNDVVDAKLTPGEIVIDLDTLKEKGKVGDAARMVAEALKNKHGSSNKSEEGDFKSALKDAIKSRKPKNAKE